MQTIVSRVWIFILLYGAFQAWTIYEAHQEKMREIEGSIPRIESQIRKSKREIKQIQSYKRDIEEAKKNIELVAQEVESLQKKLPEVIKDTENLALLQDIAEGLNIKNIFMSPGIEENRGFYFTKRYEFSASGTFLQFLIFFEKIASSERLLNVRQVVISRSDKMQRGRFQLVDAKVTIEAYRYNPSHKEDRGISKIEKTFTGKPKQANPKAKNNRKKK